MAKYTIEGSTLTGIADAIRTQYGEDTPIAVSDMAEAILGIEGGGGGLPEGWESGEIELLSDTNVLTIEHDAGRGNYLLLLISNLPVTMKIIFAFHGVSGSIVRSSAMATFIGRLNNVSVGNAFTMTADSNTLTYDGTGKTNQVYFNGNYTWYIIPIID